MNNIHINYYTSFKKGVPPRCQPHFSGRIAHGYGHAHRFLRASLSWRSQAWDVDVHGLKPRRSTQRNGDFLFFQNRGLWECNLSAVFLQYMTRRLRLKLQHSSDLFFGGGFLCNQFSPPKKNNTKNNFSATNSPRKKNNKNLTLNDFGGVSTSCFRDLDLFLSELHGQ